MEFSFKLYDFIQQIEATPHFMVMWAAFGVPALMLVLALPFYILRKAGLYPYIKPFITLLYTALGITWLTGFVTLMILLFTGVSGIRMLLIWLLLFVTYFVFSIFNRNSLNRWFADLSKQKTTENSG